MRKKKGYERVLAFLLTAVLVATSLPQLTAVWASQMEDEVQVVEEEQQQQQEQQADQQTGDDQQVAVEEEEQPVVEEAVAEPTEMAEDDDDVLDVTDPVNGATSLPWTFDCYYVNQSSRYDVTFTKDFSLKYQMEFHTSNTVPEKGVTVRIPAALLTCRPGTSSKDAQASLVPTDVGVPQVTKADYENGNYSASSSTSFNYYLDEDTQELVFFNYKKITSGSNAAWQVSYNGLKLMNIIDGTEWKLTPTITVTYGSDVYDNVTESLESTPLTGRIDSSVVLSTTSKQSFNDGTHTYGPGLYTQIQVSKYINGSLPEKYSGDNFNNYKYVVWMVTAKGSGNQPFNLDIIENPSVGGVTGEVVGYSSSGSETNSVTMDRWDGTMGASNARPAGKNAGSVRMATNVKMSNWTARIYVVVAYPADAVTETTMLENSVTVQVIPYDGLDADQARSASAKWTYQNYKWSYGGGGSGSGLPIDVTHGDDATYVAWLNVYRQAQQEKQDKGDFLFTTTSNCYGYQYTHNTSSDSGTLGAYIEDTAYQVSTVSDALYAYTDQGHTYQMTDKDYYFSSVEITQTDVGLDVWENLVTSPEEIEGVDRSLKIYAMFEGSSDWELVDTVDWNSKRMTYTFSDEALARKPYRVMAVHDATDYKTSCVIKATAKIKYDSPIFASILADDSVTEATVESLGGVMAKYYTSYSNQIEGGWIQPVSVSQYQYLDGLADFTQNAYGTLAMRDNAYITLKSIREVAGSHKAVISTENDPDNGRVNVTYALTAYDGYQLYSEEAANYLKDTIKSPGRNKVAFYDLLPYGMSFDPSQDVQAGIAKVPNYTVVGSWEQGQVDVTVDPDTDVITDWRGTGRTMVIFHLTYTGANPSFFYQSGGSDGMLVESWGVSFGTYFAWKDKKMISAEENICAFIPEDDVPLLGGSGNHVLKDDGKDVDGNALSGDYAPFASGNLSGREDLIGEERVLYAKSIADVDVPVASESSITKLVKADEDRFSAFSTSTAVTPGEGYTYEITVKSVINPLKDIVIYDNLENAAEARSESPGETMVFEDSWWMGYFNGLVTNGLDTHNIAPVIYYNKDREATTTTNKVDKPADVLTHENGWYTSDEWEENGWELSDVKAVAVDISKKTDGTDFVLEEGESVSFRIKMTAPDYKEYGDDIKPNGTIYAYNHPAWYSLSINDGIYETVIGDSVRVRLHDSEDLEIEKEYANPQDVPTSLQDESFRFTLWQYVEETTREKDDQGNTTGTSTETVKKYIANREYQLWVKQEDGTWVQDKTKVHATDSKGRIKLAAGQKAVFKNLTDVDSINIDEEESTYWKVEKESNTTTEEISEDEVKKTRSVKITNTYRSVLYLQKVLESVPDGQNFDNETFTFQILYGDDLQPLANTEYWIVDKARTDGGIPEKLGSGVTDENGQVQIKKGQTLAVFLDQSGTPYQVKETQASDDWICKQDTVTGKISSSGSLASITNYYKWKDLLITKALTHQDPADCNQEFTFTVGTITDQVDDEGNPVVEPLSNAKWILMEDGKETNTTGTLDENGSFTLKAGQTIKIPHQLAGTKVQIQETDSGEFYQADNDGIVQATIPSYSSNRKVTITNDYLKRSLSITKTVIYDQTDLAEQATAEAASFTMTVETEDGVVADYPYTLTKNGVEIETDVEHKTDENGQLQLKNGQTAVLKDLDVKGTEYTVTETPDEKYPQIYPADNMPQEGTLGDDDSEITFINGQSGSLMISKDYTAADETAQAYLDGVKNKISAMEAGSAATLLKVSLNLKVTSGLGGSYLWPQTDQSVTVFNQLNGKKKAVTWKAGSSITIDPYEMIILDASQLSGVTSYELSEAPENQDNLIYLKGLGNVQYEYLHITQVSPADNQAVSRDLAAMPMANITNQIEILNSSSYCLKEMTEESTEVPEGSQLVWRVEQYNGSVWSPAAGISYIVTEVGGEPLEGGVQATGSNGEIVLTKADSQSLEVVFTKDQVYLTKETWSTGDLRVVEVPEKSDEAWGLQVGYLKVSGELGAEDCKISSVGLGSYSENMAGFLNSNEKVPVEIEKQLATASDDSFTMILTQVMEITGVEPIEDPSQITKSQVRSGIQYDVYDTETNALVSTNTTDSKGAITLHAGQYAKLNLPEGTIWTVSEKNSANYVISDLSGNTDDGLTKLGNNLMIIQQGKVRHWMEETTITKGMLTGGTVYDLNGNQLDLTTGDVTIPSHVMVDGKLLLVTGIEDGAFEGQTGITSITLPDSLESIGDDAFKDCTGITGTVTIPGSVENIGDGAFEGCTGITKVEIGDGVETIGESAFEGCSSLTTVEFPDSLTEIGSNAFKDCDLTGDLSIPSGVKNIEPYTFYGCKNLTSITIDDGVVSIGDNAFYGCSGATGTLTIPSSVTTIGAHAFELCTGLTGLELNSGLTTIGDNAFYKCSSMTGDLVIPDTVTSIGGSAFQGTKFTSLTLNEGLTTMGASAFKEMTALKGSLTIPGTLKTIPESAFEGCTSLESLTIESGVTKISNKAFYNCKGLTGTLTIPSTVTQLGTVETNQWAGESKNGAFVYCSGLTAVVIEEGVPYIGNETFEYCTGLTSITIPSTAKYIYNYAFQYCNSMIEIDVPEGVEWIGRTAFGKGADLEKIVLPTTLKTVQLAAFQSNEKLKSVTFRGDTLKGNLSFGLNCFSGDTALTELQLPEGVTYIDGYCFEGCKSLTEVTLPSTLTTLYDWAFSGCTRLQKVTFKDSPANIATGSFNACVSLTDVNLGNKLKSIGSSAFSSCSSMDTLEIPATVTSVSTNAFKGCKSTLQITIHGTANRFTNPDNGDVVWLGDDN
jgi:hypothetical protein